MKGKGCYSVSLPSVVPARGSSQSSLLQDSPKISNENFLLCQEIIRYAFDNKPNKHEL